MQVRLFCDEHCLLVRGILITVLQLFWSLHALAWILLMQLSHSVQLQDSMHPVFCMQLDVSAGLLKVLPQLFLSVHKRLRALPSQALQVLQDQFSLHADWLTVQDVVSDGFLLVLLQLFKSVHTLDWMLLTQLLHAVQFQFSEHPDVHDLSSILSIVILVQLFVVRHVLGCTELMHLLHKSQLVVLVHAGLCLVLLVLVVLEVLFPVSAKRISAPFSGAISLTELATGNVFKD